MSLNHAKSVYSYTGHMHYHHMYQLQNQAQLSGMLSSILYQLSHCWDRLPPEGDLLSHYWDYLSPEGGLLSHCWDYLSPEGGFLSHFLDCLSPKGVSCLIAGIICISRRFLVPLLIYLSPDEDFLSHFPDCLSPDGSFLSHC